MARRGFVFCGDAAPRVRRPAVKNQDVISLETLLGGQAKLDELFEETSGEDGPFFDRALIALKEWATTEQRRSDDGGHDNMRLASKEHCWGDISLKVSGKDYTGIVVQWRGEMDAARRRVTSRRRLGEAVTELHECASRICKGGKGSLGATFYANPAVVAVRNEYSGVLAGLTLVALNKHIWALQAGDEKLLDEWQDSRACKTRGAGMWKEVPPRADGSRIAIIAAQKYLANRARKRAAQTKRLQEGDEKLPPQTPRDRKQAQRNRDGPAIVNATNRAEKEGNRVEKSLIWCLRSQPRHLQPRVDAIPPPVPPHVQEDCLHRWGIGMSEKSFTEHTCFACARVQFREQMVLDPNTAGMPDGERDLYEFSLKQLIEWLAERAVASRASVRSACKTSKEPAWQGATVLEAMKVPPRPGGIVWRLEDMTFKDDNERPRYRVLPFAYNASVGGAGGGDGATVPRSPQVDRLADFAGYEVHQLRAYRLQKLKWGGGQDVDDPPIVLRRGMIVVPFPEPRRLLIRVEAVDGVDQDSSTRDTNARIGTWEKSPGGRKGTVVRGEGRYRPLRPSDGWIGGVALRFRTESDATKAAHRLRADDRLSGCRILREKPDAAGVAKGVATRVTLVGVSLATINTIIGVDLEVKRSSFYELAIDFATHDEASRAVSSSAGEGRLYLPTAKEVTYRIEGHLDFDFCDVRDTDGWAFDAYCGIQGEVGALRSNGAFGERTSAADDLSALWHRSFSLCGECNTALKIPLTPGAPRTTIPRMPRHAVANNLNLGWSHVDEVSIGHGASHINRDLDKATKGGLTLSERLACNDHMVSGGGVLRVGVHGEHKSEAKKDPSRKRGITGNFVAMYQPSSVSKVESTKMFKTGLTENILVIFLRPKSNIYAMRHAIKPLRLSRQRLENERKFFEDWKINHRSQTFYDEGTWAKYVAALPTEDDAIPRDVLDAGIYVDDDETVKSVEADTECATTARSAPTKAVLQQLEVERPREARAGDRLLVGMPGRLGMCVGRNVTNTTIRVRWADGLQEDLEGDVMDFLEARCACGSQEGGPQCKDAPDIAHQPSGTVHVLRTDGKEADVPFKDWIRRESSEPAFERSLTVDVEEGALRDDELFDGAITKLGAQRDVVRRREDEGTRKGDEDLVDGGDGGSTSNVGDDAPSLMAEASDEGELPLPGGGGGRTGPLADPLAAASEAGEPSLPNGDLWMPRSTDIKASDYDNPDQYHGLYSYQYPFRRGGTGNFRSRAIDLDTLVCADYEPEPIRRLVNVSDSAYTERALLLYGGLFEKDWHFLCRETNRRQRRETISRSIRVPMGMESKVGGATLDAIISQLQVNQKTIQAHKKNPSGSPLPAIGTDSTRAARSLMSLVEYVGKDAICSPMQRYKLGSNFISKIGWGGAQDIFITISPSDAHDIRLSKIGHHGADSNIEISYPNTWPGWFERAKHAADRPVATARWFRRMMEQVFSAILNFPLGALKARGACILGGVVTRFDFTIEETGKGALHAHGQAKIDGIDIRHLEARLENPDLRRRLFALLDSVVRQRKPGQMKSFADEARVELVAKLEAESKAELARAKQDGRNDSGPDTQGVPDAGGSDMEVVRISKEKIEAKAKMSAGKLPPTFPIKPQADELRPFFERALWGKTEAMSGAADAEGGSGLAGGSDQRPEGWTHEDDDRVTKLTNAGSVSSLLPPPDPFQYWVRLGCVPAEADPAQTPPDSRHGMTGMEETTSTLAAGIDAGERGRGFDAEADGAEDGATSSSSSSCAPPLPRKRVERLADDGDHGDAGGDSGGEDVGGTQTTIVSSDEEDEGGIGSDGIGCGDDAPAAKRGRLGSEADCRDDASWDGDMEDVSHSDKAVEGDIGRDGDGGGDEAPGAKKGKTATAAKKEKKKKPINVNAFIDDEADDDDDDDDDARRRRRRLPPPLLGRRPCYPRPSLHLPCLRRPRLHRPRLRSPPPQAASRKEPQPPTPMPTPKPKPTPTLVPKEAGADAATLMPLVP